MGVKLKSTWAWAWLAIAMLLGLVAPARAQLGTTQHIRPELIAESGEPGPGQPVALALVMTPDKGWHGYWQNPGDAGVATRVQWTLPPGAKASAFDYPLPQRLLIAGLMNYVYEGEHALLTRLTIPADAKPGAAFPVRAKLDWLACTAEVCVPESGTVALDLKIGSGAIDPAMRARFDGWRAKLPKPLGAAAYFITAGKTLRIAVPLPASVAVTDPYFFPLTENSVDYAMPQRVSRNGDALVIETAAKGTPGALDGVLAIGPANGLSVHAVPGPVPAAGEPLGTQAGAVWTWRIVVLALGGALLGGLILNVMPCVFPILSLKALSLARAGGDEGQVRWEALAYSAGVVITCLMLGIMLLSLRAGGDEVGWAFQLQMVPVVFGLLLLMVAITLNLAGLFELGSVGIGNSLATRGGAEGAFWTGALAAFVATPCTGPFMAAALGAALVVPTLIGLGIFVALGLGLASPFLAIGFVPALRTRLPKPGRWMSGFRRLMAVPMALTSLALLWLLWRQVGVMGLVVGIASSTALAVILGLLGQRERGLDMSPATAGLSVLAVTAIVTALTAPYFIPRMIGPTDTVRLATGFSEQRLAELRAENRPVFVYFTADWCLTCKVNEKVAIERRGVAAVFKAHHVATLAGDWTNGDPAISRFLEQHGRSGVPFYLFYRPGRSEPEVLPQVLTPGILVKLVS